MLQDMHNAAYDEGYSAGRRAGYQSEAASVERLLAERERLAQALIDLVRRCDGDEGVRADGSNIQTIEAHAALDALGIEWC